MIILISVKTQRNAPPPLESFLNNFLIPEDINILKANFTPWDTWM